MINLIAYIGIYIMIVIAVFLTVGFAWFLIVGRALAKRKRMWDDEWETMHQRIKRRKELNGKATDHKIDLGVIKRGGWNGPIPQSKNAPPKPPHNPHK